MVVTTQLTNRVTPQNIQVTNQQLGVEVGDTRRSTSNLEDIVRQIAIKCADSGNPVQMLQCLQDSVIVERALEINEFVSESLKGDFNFILVNRNNLLETTFDEIQLIKNPRLTLQVQFYGEVSNSQ